MASNNKQQKRQIACFKQWVKNKINGYNSRTRSTFKGDGDAQPRKKTNGFHNLEMTCWKTTKTISSNFDSKEGNQAKRQ